MLQKKTTYEEISRKDQGKFADLEATMRMLYDHGNMKFETSAFLGDVIHKNMNASMREPKKASVQSKTRRDSKVTEVLGKRKKQEL